MNQYDPMLHWRPIFDGPLPAAERPVPKKCSLRSVPQVFSAGGHRQQSPSEPIASYGGQSRGHGEGP